MCFYCCNLRYIKSHFGFVVLYFGVVGVKQNATCSTKAPNGADYGENTQWCH